MDSVTPLLVLYKCINIYIFLFNRILRIIIHFIYLFSLSLFCCRQRFHPDPPPITFFLEKCKNDCVMNESFPRIPLKIFFLFNKKRKKETKPISSLYFFIFSLFLSLTLSLCSNDYHCHFTIIYFILICQRKK